MRREDQINRASRPRPPPPPSEATPPEQEGATGLFPKLIKLMIATLTCIGIIYALRVAATRSEDSKPSSSDGSNIITNVSAPTEIEDAEKQEPVQTNTGTLTEPIGTEKSVAAKNDILPDVAQTTTENPLIRFDGLAVELGIIERDLKAKLANPDTTVYQHISENIRQCLQIQLAILKRKTNANGEDDRYESIKKKLEQLQLQDDAPYYTSVIAEYSRLVAEASLAICALFKGDKTDIARQRSESELAAIRRPLFERTCDATFVTAYALLSASKAQKGSEVNSLTWNELERSIQAQRSLEQHVIQKTETAHRALCDVLTRCISVWDKSGTNVKTAALIERQRDDNITKAKDRFYRIAAYTEAEARLFVVWACSLDR